MCHCENPPTVYERDEVRARKAHTCCECRRERIAAGDTYWRHSGLWDGRWDTFKRCQRCESAALALASEDVDLECLTFGALRNELKQRMRWRHRRPVTLYGEGGA